MPELTVPDELFDADSIASDEHRLAERFDWIIQDGQIVHAPVVGWAWACPKCGESGTLPEALLLFSTVPPRTGNSTQLARSTPSGRSWSPSCASSLALLWEPTEAPASIRRGISHERTHDHRDAVHGLSYAPSAAWTSSFAPRTAAVSPSTLNCPVSPSNASMTAWRSCDG